MRRLLLLRHAKAVPAEEPLADIARPLAERGERDARRIGERLNAHGIRPPRVLTSPAARALHTAQLVAAATGCAAETLVLEWRLYLAEPAAILDIVAAQPAALESLLLVGHNPGLTELVHELLPGFAADDLPTAAVVALDYADAADWTGIARGAGRLAYYDYPKNRGAPVTGR